MLPLSFWDNALSQSQKTMQHQSFNSYNLWQMPVAYWQTVSTIMGLRASATQQLCQQLLTGCAQLSGCKNPTDWANTCLSIQRQCASTLTQLHLSTHQNRAELWRNWQILATRAAPLGSFSAWQPQAGVWMQAQPAAHSVSSAAPTLAPSAGAGYGVQQPKGWFVAGNPSTKATTNPATPTAQARVPEPAQAIATKAKAANANNVTEIRPQNLPTQAAQDTPKPASQSQNLLFAVGQNYAAAPQHGASTAPAPAADRAPEPSAAGHAVTVSATANSVMRTGSGASIGAAAAATRRSVLARHASRKGRLSRAR